jgi:hypothetical protein
MPLDATWVGALGYKPPGHTISVSWDAISTIGAGIAGAETFGSTSVIQDRIISPSGLFSETFGVVQTSPTSKYIHSTGTQIATWVGMNAYAPPTGILGAGWSENVTIQVSGIASNLTFGSALVYTDQIIGPSGFFSEEFGDSYVLHWYEYAPPRWVLDASWVGKNEYHPPIGTLDVLWQPDIGAQTIAPLSFGGEEFGSANIGFSLYPSGWLSENFGTPQVSSDLDFNLLFFTGEEVADFELPRFHTFQFDFLEGATAQAVLSANILLPINDFVEGASATLALDTRPAALFDINVFEGASASTPLSTTVAIQANLYEGSSVSLDIAINPAAIIVATANEGATASFALSTAIQLGSLNFYEGANVSASLDTLENYKVYEGATLAFILSTSDSVSPIIYSGESVSIDISVFPSSGIGVLNAKEGSSVSLSFTTLPQVLLYPNVIVANQDFNYDILGYMGIDLNNTACCPIKDDPARIELTAAPEPDEKYDGDKVVFTAELSTLPRFSLQMYAGETFYQVDPESFVFNFFDGSSCHIPAITYNEYNFNLCSGNFIPDGDHVNVELVATDSICSDSILIFSGESAKVDIQNNVQFQIPLHDGARLEFDIILQSAWILNFYGGENLRISNIDLAANFQEGAEVSIQFEEKDITGFEGAVMEFNLSTDYDVEFLEVGCLENEFVPANENGDPDMERFNPVPVELDFFSHSIKARCF